ncbi:MAG: hypothetical protein OEU90_07040 [Gammaproteobacteria bacterium]|nr:hypothetical protein [Gammaproteobacteria bacterium]MDH3751486.1 hypothetical protein [Gammaproteobacteria bacterium]MDH3805212.1 hypothetical protein [Gammaproteobacteria bacterium]
MKTEKEIQELYEQVKHLIGSDQPIDNPFEVVPHEFSGDELTRLHEVFPDGISEAQSKRFIEQLSNLVGIYHRLSDSADKEIPNSQARKELKALRKSVASSHSLFVNLSSPLTRNIDIAVQHVQQMKEIESSGKSAGYVWSFSAPYSDLTAEWVQSLTTHMEELVNALDLIESKLKSNSGGAPVDRAMSYLANRVAVEYKKCFDQMPSNIEEMHFERILSVLAEIVGRHGAGVFSVMHFVRKGVDNLNILDAQGVKY